MATNSNYDSTNQKDCSSDQGDHLNFLRCFLCHRSYTNPKLLPCLHSFCFTCLESIPSYLDNEKSNNNSENDEDNSPISLENTSSRPKQSITCPMCKTNAPLPKTGLSGLKDNLLVIEMIRRWEEKLCENEPRSKRSTSETKFPQNGNSENHTATQSEDINTSNESCQCIPLWKNITRGGKTINGNTTTLQGLDSHEFLSADELQSQFFCFTCDVMVCRTCKLSSHSKHQTLPYGKALKERHEYLDQLLKKLLSKKNDCDASVIQVYNSSVHFDDSAEKIAKEIEKRSEQMVSAIIAQKEHLLEEIKISVAHNQQKVEESKKYLENQDEKLSAAAKFTSELLEFGSGSNLMYLTNDVSDRLLKLIGQRLLFHRNVVNIRLEVPEIGFDENHVHKLFGSLKQSEVNCGTAQLLKSFDLDLKWPTGMATTLNMDFVVTGKMGAFEEKGKVMFFTRSGQLKNEYELHEKCIPYDTTVTNDGLVLVADNAGNIHKFNSSGRKIETMTDKFKGVGRLATFHRGVDKFAITSSDEGLVKVYDHSGALQYSLPSKNSPTKLEHPHYVATNNYNDIVVSDFKLHAVFGFNSSGDLIFEYSGNGTNEGDLKCPSAVCCDSFNNILVADFMNDRVHMISPKGQFLGYLLTKDNSITCPNFLSSDDEGRLYVGQYGGQIQVFQYMGYLKFV